MAETRAQGAANRISRRKAIKPASGTAERNSLNQAERDVIALGIIVAAVILFIGTGSHALIVTTRAIAQGQAGADPILLNTLILNIALIIFGWRRYNDLNHEVAERRRAEENATTIARTDPLTGCLNRRSFAPAAQALAVSAQARGQTVAMVMLDLDRFKHINDVYGHRAGDAVLVEAVARIRRLLPEGALIGRLGGDEFACAVPHPAGKPEAIEDLANAILSQFDAPITIGDQQVETSTSIGLASIEATASIEAPDGDEPAPGAEDLLHRADLAMYQAKKFGRRRYFWFENGMAREMRFRSDMEREIREAIPRGEFVPYYEKQVDLETGQITGFEMLARWQSPRFGLLQPEAFIAIAEEIGVIGALSESLIAQALRDAREWGPGITLSVNISPVQLRDSWFAQKLLKLMVAANFPPERLELEITETCLHENIGVVRSLITSLKNQGVRISLDDFGTGYSSLSQLRSLPFDRLKIDRSFISTMDESRESKTIISAIVSLGEGMGLPITAEGIETPEVLAQLKKFGTFKGQGYLYGHPGDAATARHWLELDNPVADQAAADREAAALRELPLAPRAARG